MGISEIIISIIVIAIIGVAYYLINDSRKKGIHVCSKGCSGCPHPCHSDGTPKPEFALKKPTTPTENPPQQDNEKPEEEEVVEEIENTVKIFSETEESQQEDKKE
jgi:hypothetical protein